MGKREEPTEVWALLEIHLLYETGFVLQISRLTLNNNSRGLLNSFISGLIVFLRAICLLIRLNNNQLSYQVKHLILFHIYFRYGILLILYPVPYFMPVIEHLWWNVFIKTIETSGNTETCTLITC